MATKVGRREKEIFFLLFSFHKSFSLLSEHLLPRAELVIGRQEENAVGGSIAPQHRAAEPKMAVPSSIYLGVCVSTELSFFPNSEYRKKFFFLDSFFTS